MWKLYKDCAVKKKTTAPTGTTELRLQADQQLPSISAFLQGVQDSLSAHIAILDKNGVIVHVNAAWRTFGESNGLQCNAHCLGVNYLELCDSASGENSEEARLTSRAIRDVLAGVQQEARIEYPCDGPDEKRWFLLKVTKFEAEGDVWIVLAHENITELKQAETALRVEKANIDAIFESSPVAMFILDETTNIVQLNAAAIHLTGGSASEAVQHRPGNALRCIHSSKDPRGCGYSKICKVCNVRNGIEALITTGGTIHGAELVLDLMRDGVAQKVWMNVGAETIQLNGRQHVCVAMDDITERKQMEEKLREAELKYHALFESAADAILLFADGRWIDCNASALGIFGCTREQIIGAHPSRFSPPMQPDGRSSEEESIRMINLAYTVGPQVFEWEHCHADGTPFAAEVSLNRLDLGGKPCIQAIVRDVSGRKRTYEALQASEQQHRTLLQTAMDGFWMVDMQGCMLEVNETYCQMSGYSEQELLSMHIPDLESNESANDTASHIQKIIEQGEDRFESLHRHKDGSIYNVEVSVQYRPEEAGGWWLLYKTSPSASEWKMR